MRVRAGQVVTLTTTAGNRKIGLHDPDVSGHDAEDVEPSLQRQQRLSPVCVVMVSCWAVRSQDKVLLPQEEGHRRKTIRVKVEQGMHKLELRILALRGRELKKVF